MTPQLEPRISMIIPVWNKAGFITDLIQSVKNQTFDAWELILIDDGSSDASLEVMKLASMGDPRITVHSIENGGVCRARNYGYAFVSASSEFVQFPDADDVLHPDLLETLISILDGDASVSTCYCRYTCIDQDGQSINTSYDKRKVRFGPFFREQSDDDHRTQLVSIVSWAPMIEPVSIIRRSAFEHSNQWDIDLGQHGEGVLLFSEMALKGDICFVNKPLYVYRKHSEQHSADVDNVGIQQRKVTLKLLAYTGSVTNQARIRDAVIFYEGTVRSLQGMQFGWRLLHSGDVSKGLRTIIAGVWRWTISTLMPTLFISRLERECYSYLRAQGVDWKPADKWKVGRSE
ncbi:MAG: glycosyltransferase family 2 protein [Armatimonadota bacterium]